MLDSPQKIARYWTESAQPLASLLLVAPFLVAYELGLLWWDQRALQNAAELWLRRGLGSVGYEQQLFLPIFVCGLLLAAHHYARHPWRIRWSVLPPMLCESLLCGFVLVALFQFQSALTTRLHLESVAPVMAIHGGGNRVALLGYVGTGIYEELFFRVLIITPLAWLLQRCGETKQMSLTTAAVVSSLLFALAHFQALNITGEDFQWFTFIFRFLAGGLFASLYVFRGFGITAGTHVAYDILIASCP